MVASNFFQRLRKTLVRRWRLVLVIGATFVTIITLAYTVGPILLTKILPSQTTTHRIELLPPENLTGNEALSRSLSNFDRVLEGELKRMLLALYNMLEATPRQDSEGLSAIRLNGLDVRLATGAPVDHPLFEWTHIATTTKHTTPTISAHLTSDDSPPPGAYRIRFIGSASEANKGRFGNESTNASIVIEVSAQREGVRDTCRINHPIEAIFPKNDQVALEPIFASVAACILSDFFSHLPPDEQPTLFRYLFHRPDVSDTTRVTHAIQGIEQYDFFATQWHTRPDDASKALAKAIDHFEGALKKDKGSIIEPASYPIIGYLYAHALTSIIVGYAGRQPVEESAQSSNRQKLEKTIKASFSTPPFDKTPASEALALDALREFRRSVVAWKAAAGIHDQRLVQLGPVEFKNESKPTAKEVAHAIKVAREIRKRIATKSRLMLAYRSVGDKKKAAGVRRAIESDIGALDEQPLKSVTVHSKKKNKIGAAKAEIDGAIVKASFQFDLAVDHLNVFLQAMAELEKLRMTPSVLTALAESTESGKLQDAPPPGDEDFCSDDDSISLEQVEHTKAECREDLRKCEGLRTQAISRYQQVGKRFLGAAHRKLARASDILRKQKEEICTNMDSIAECDDLAEPTGHTKAEGLPIRLRLLDDLEASVELVREIFECYAPDFKLTACNPSQVNAGTAKSNTKPQASASPSSNPAVPQVEQGARRWHRWLDRPNLHARIVNMFATCAIQRTLVKQEKGAQLAAQMRYGALPEVWAEQPPSLEQIEQAMSKLASALRNDVYRREIPIARALFSYARVWSVAPAAAKWLNARAEFPSTVTCVKEQCETQKLKEELESVGRAAILGKGETEVDPWAILANIGDALSALSRDRDDVGLESHDIQALSTCRPSDNPQPGCILSKAITTYSAWASGAVKEPLAPRELFQEGWRRAQLLRQELRYRITKAYNVLAHDFFAHVQNGINAGQADSLEMQILRIGFFRVLLLPGAPTEVNEKVNHIGVAAINQMVARTGDVRQLRFEAMKRELGPASKQLGFRLGRSKGWALVDSTRAVEEAGKSVIAAEHPSFQPCDATSSLRQFIGYAAVRRGLFRASWLHDPHADASMVLVDNLKRWCDLRGLAIVSEAAILRSLIAYDLRRFTMSAEPKGRLNTLAKMVGSDAFLIYVYARNLLSAGDHRTVLPLVRSARHLDGRTLRARALLADGKAAQAMTVATSVARAYEAMRAGDNFVLDGAIYRTLGDAALKTGALGGLPKEDDAPAEKFRPRPEFGVAVKAYLKALGRPSVEDDTSLKLRLAVALVESYADNDAVSVVQPSNWIEGRVCHKWRLIGALAKWARGERRSALGMIGNAAEGSLFDIEMPMSSGQCKHDVTPIPLGWRSKWMRKELLRNLAEVEIVK